VTFERDVSEELRVYVLGRNDLFCRMCGTAPGDVDDLTGDLATFHVGLDPHKSLGGKDELSNFRTLCSTCNQGAKNITAEKPSAIWLLSQVRRAGQEEQRAVLEWLNKKFKE
jgi:5-methylcytosine-specific restriction endonuclease McrA